jgi:lipid-binding SYLF domain-containing protein
MKGWQVGCEDSVVVLILCTEEFFENFLDYKHWSSLMKICIGMGQVKYLIS